MQTKDLNNAPLAWANLESLPTKDLRRMWREHIGRGPVPRLKRELLIGALTYELQAQSFGRLKTRTQRQLQQLLANPDALLKASKAVSPGTRLVREWQGHTHIVDAEEDGFIWQGCKYKSLSAIARSITGTRWSGPRFFGVKNAERTDA